MSYYRHTACHNNVQRRTHMSWSLRSRESSAILGKSGPFSTSPASCPWHSRQGKCDATRPILYTLQDRHCLFRRRNHTLCCSMVPLTTFYPNPADFLKPQGWCDQSRFVSQPYHASLPSSYRVSHTSSRKVKPSRRSQRPLAPGIHPSLAWRSPASTRTWLSQASQLHKCLDT